MMKREGLIKVSIVIAVFLLGTVVFKLLQNDYIFSHTLGRIAITYYNTTSVSNVSEAEIVKTKKPFTSLDESNFIHWDVYFFKYMSQHTYGKDDTWPGLGTYAFSPLFPFIWRVSHLPAKYIAIVNYLMFGLSLIILSSLLLSPGDFKTADRICLFALALTMPFVFSFYLPYCESTYFFTMSVAIFGLFKNKYWLFFLGMVMFTLSRPSFLIFGPAFICTDIYFLILNKKLKPFLKEAGLKILPILIGILITFFIQYENSGKFFKMFQVHSQFWGHSLKLPKTITDWSTEGYGMNIFAVCGVVSPSFLLILIYLLKNFKSTKLLPVSLFSSETRKEYLFVLSVIYFTGCFLFVGLSQGGNLSGLHRYVLASPFFYIFFFILILKIRSYDYRYVLGVLVPMVILGYLLLIHGPYQHQITFLDSGFFLLVITLMYVLFFNSMKISVRYLFLMLIIFCNTIWLCYLYNHFLNNAFIIA
jgi:hypothetical protein